MKFRRRIVNTNYIGRRIDFRCLNRKKKKTKRLTFLAPYSLHSLYWATKIKFYHQSVNTSDIGQRKLSFVAEL